MFIFSLIIYLFIYLCFQQTLHSECIMKINKIWKWTDRTTKDRPTDRHENSYIYTFVWSGVLRLSQYC